MNIPTLAAYVMLVCGFAFLGEKIAWIFLEMIVIQCIYLEFPTCQAFMSASSPPPRSPPRFLLPFAGHVNFRGRGYLLPTCQQHEVGAIVYEKTLFRVAKFNHF